MSIKSMNWKLTILGLFFAAAFAGLGFWQLSRAHQKDEQLRQFNKNLVGKPLETKDLKTPNDWRYYKLEAKGRFENNHTFLLDNKTYDGKIGYEVYTPFTAKGLDLTLLVDRGFIPIGESRANLPTIKPIKGKITLTGMLNLPPAYQSMGNMVDDPNATQSTWPLRVEYINMPEIAKQLGTNVYPYVLQLEPKSPYAYAIEWKVFIMGPERHRGYAVQWFALSLTLLIISVVLNWRQFKSTKKATAKK